MNPTATADGKLVNILNDISVSDDQLHERFEDALTLNADLDRTLVSFQANKSQNGFRWYKFKEGFSRALIQYIIDYIGLNVGNVLDPFAGSGTTLMTAHDNGIDSTGIELLPIGAEIIEVRKLLKSVDPNPVASAIADFTSSQVWTTEGKRKKVLEIRITMGAYPQETTQQIGRYLNEIGQIEDLVLRRILRFALLCVLESVSYTRKDGQYLRWDYRSNRNVGKKKFDKGKILSFTDAICEKLGQISKDITQYSPTMFNNDMDRGHGNIELHVGSCLDIMPSLPTEHYDALITSPPYCNRYDYTRTYALELAMLGVREEGIKSLRQAMLSCTVENREKNWLGLRFDENTMERALHAFQNQELLSHILTYLDECRASGKLNNNGIPRMVRNYFKEMAVVIFESARLLKPQARFVMVNDNVRYQGIPIPVDLILSDFAEKAGFTVDAIWYLPRGKGNSSQQMDAFGRKELRKCVYLWTR